MSRDAFDFLGNIPYKKEAEAYLAPYPSVWDGSDVVLGRKWLKDRDGEHELLFLGVQDLRKFVHTSHKLNTN